MSSLCYRYPCFPRPKQIANTDLFLETWLYCISNPSQVDDMPNCAKFVENVCRAIYWKTKLNMSCKWWKKVWKNGVPLSIPLCSCTFSYIGLLFFEDSGDPWLCISQSLFILPFLTSEDLCFRGILHTKQKENKTQIQWPFSLRSWVAEQQEDFLL